MMMAIAPYAFIVGVLLGLWRANLPRNRRNEQWLFPWAAIVLSVAALALIYWLRDHYLSLLSRYDEWVQWLEVMLPVALPQDVSDLLPWLNGAFLLLFLLAKLFLRGVVWLSSKVRRLSAQGSSAWGAYVHVKDKGWYLQPEWYFALQFFRALTVLALLLLLVCWQVYEGRWLPGMTPIFPAMALVIFGECAAYLGGQSMASGSVEFRGEDVTASAFGNYATVWKEMLSTWPMHWLATGWERIWRRPHGPE